MMTGLNYVIGALLVTSFYYLFVKISVKKTEPYLAVGIFMIVVFLLKNSATGMDLVGLAQSFSAISASQDTLVQALLISTLYAIIWVLVFKGLSKAAISKFVIIYYGVGKLSEYLINIFWLKEPTNLTQGVALIVIFAGVVLGAELKGDAIKGYIPVFGAAIAMAAVKVISSNFTTINVNGVDSVEFLMGTIMVWIWILISGTFQKAGETPFVGALCAIIAGVLFASSERIPQKALELPTELQADSLTVERLKCFDVVFIIILAMIFCKEKMSKNAWIGVALLVAGRYMLTLPDNFIPFEISFIG